MDTQDPPLNSTTLTDQANKLLALLVRSIPLHADIDRFRAIPLDDAMSAVGGDKALKSTLDILLNTRTNLATSVEGTPAPIIRTAWTDRDELIYGIDGALVSHFRAHGKLACDLFRYDFSAVAH